MPLYLHNLNYMLLQNHDTKTRYMCSYYQNITSKTRDTFQLLEKFDIKNQGCSSTPPVTESIILPLTEMKWLYYISDSLSSIKASSINTYITGIKYHASINGYPVDTSEMYQYKQAKKSLTNVFDAKNRKLRKPFTFEMIKNAYKYFDLLQYNELVIYTSIICSMQSLMRPSEFAAQNMKVQPINLKIHHIKHYL